MTGGRPFQHAPNRFGFTPPPPPPPPAVASGVGFTRPPPPPPPPRPGSSMPVPPSPPRHPSTLDARRFSADMAPGRLAGDGLEANTGTEDEQVSCQKATGPPHRSSVRFDTHDWDGAGENDSPVSTRRSWYGKAIGRAPSSRVSLGRSSDPSHPSTGHAVRPRRLHPPV